MSKEIKISDWVTEEEFNYSPTGELSAVLYLAEQRSEWFAKGEKAAEERIIKLLEGIAITTKHDKVAVMELLSAIVALIKGEQN